MKPIKQFFPDIYERGIIVSNKADYHNKIYRDLWRDVGAMCTAKIRLLVERVIIW